MNSTASITALTPFHSLAKNHVYIGVTNHLLSGPVTIDTFPVVEWQTNFQALIGEATLLRLLTSELHCLLVRIDCTKVAFQAGGRIESELWRYFISQLEESSLARKKAKLIFSFDRNTPYDPQLIDKLLELRESIYPIPVSIECHHRTWHIRDSLATLRQARMNIVQHDMPSLSGFNVEPVNFDSKWCLIRLLGRNQATWFSKDPNERYAYQYTNSELVELTNRMRRMKEEFDSLYVIAANRPSTVAFANLADLAKAYIKK